MDTNPSIVIAQTLVIKQYRGIEMVV